MAGGGSNVASAGIALTGQVALVTGGGTCLCSDFDHLATAKFSVGTVVKVNSACYFRRE
jgi:hypothetical protein